MKRYLLIPLLSLSALSFTSCAKTNPLNVQYEDLVRADIDDNYCNFYQIFPISFADSDGNGKGDLKGIIDKLDYIYEMGYNGIWLNPIYPSSTSHHYDVEDYLDVSSQFDDFPTNKSGALARFDELVSKCHEKGIKIILDMVLNHSSNKNEWFTESYLSAKIDLKKDESKWTKETKRYNWVSCPAGSNIPKGYHKVNDSDSIAYESVFDSSMPDFNLTQLINGEEGDELESLFTEVFRFWLEDHHVDGFRFDAVNEFFTGDVTKNLQVLTWMNNACRAIKQDCYLVGEGDWSSNSAKNKTYQESGFNSFFQFANSAKNTGYIQQTVVQQSAKTIFTALQRNFENAAGGIEAPFLGNHDTPRYVGGVSGRGSDGINNTKFSLGLLQQLRGATFTYYGDEVGMASQSTTADGWYRLPIRWGDSYTTDLTKLSLYGVSQKSLDERLSYPFGTVNDQKGDANSVLNYAKKANLIRLALPEIARGDFELVYAPNNQFVVIKRTYNNSSIYVAINASKSTPVTIDYTKYGTTPVAELCPSGNVTYEEQGSNNVIIPAQSIFIIK